MERLIEVFTIFSKYTQHKYPIHTDYELLIITPSVKREDVSAEDLKRLEELDFFWNENKECFCTFT